MHHRDEISHYFFDADTLFVEITNFFPQIPNDSEVARCDIARPDLLDTEHENAKKRVLDSNVVCSVQTLFSDKQKFLLHDLLNFGKANLSKFFVLFWKSEAHLWIFFIFGVKHLYFLLDVVEEHVEIDRDPIIRMLLPLHHHWHVLSVADTLAELHEVLWDEAHTTLLAFGFTLDYQSEDFVTTGLKQVAELLNPQLVKQNLEAFADFFHFGLFLRT